MRALSKSIGTTLDLTADPYHAFREWPRRSLVQAIETQLLFVD